jgi:GDP-L-fucose synthase
VVPALLRKFHEALQQNAPEVTIWGTGTVRREFMHVDDFADAALFLMLKYDREQIINVGTGEDVTIRELAGLVREVTGYQGRLAFDTSKPDGTPRKLLDVSGLRALGWRPRISLRDGLKNTYEWFVANERERVG